MDAVQLNKKATYSKPLLQLENQICFDLQLLVRKILALYRPKLQAVGLTHTQYLVMLVVWEHDELSEEGEAMTFSEISRRLQLDSGTLTPLMKRLEEKNLIQRIRCQQDERVVQIKVTREGQQLRQKMEELPMHLLACSGASVSEAIELKQLLAFWHTKLDS